MNTVKILEITRPNPNPKNFEGKALLNGWEVTFNMNEKPEGEIKANWIIFPKNVGWSRIIKGSTSTGHKFYACETIIKQIKVEKLLK